MGQMWLFSNAVTWKRNGYNYVNESDAGLSHPSGTLLEIFTARIPLHSGKVHIASSKLQEGMRCPKGVTITHERKRASLIVLQIVTNQKCLFINHIEDINTNLLLMWSIMLVTTHNMNLYLSSIYLEWLLMPHS